MPSIDISEEKGVRYLHFGSRWVQGAMRIARPWALELEYTRELMLPLALREDDWPASVLQVGLGAASITRFIYRHRPGARIAVVEISERVVEAARRYFRLPDDPRVAIRIDDGHEYLMAARSRFDLIVVDGFDARARAGMLDSAPFYANCRSRLSPAGLLAVNLIRHGRELSASLQRIAWAFDARAFALPPSGDGNVVAFANAGPRIEVTYEELKRLVLRFRAATGVNLAPTVARLGATPVRRVGLSF